MSCATSLHSVEHFVNLVRNGKYRGCSNGAGAARAIALAILDNVTVLDGEAVEGLCEWINYAKYSPDKAREWLGK